MQSTAAFIYAMPTLGRGGGRGEEEFSYRLLNIKLELNPIKKKLKTEMTGGFSIIS